MAIETVRRDPFAYILSCLKRLVRAFKQISNENGHFLLLPLAALGWLLGWKKEGVRAIGFLAAGFISVHTLITIQPRYLTAAVPLLYLLAAGGLLEILEKIPRLKTGWAPRTETSSAFFHACGALIVLVFALSCAFCLTDAMDGRPDLSAPACSAEAKKFNDAGVASFLSGNPRTAKTELTKSLQADPVCVEALLNLGVIHHAQGAFQEAENFIDQAVRILENHGTPSSLLAQALFSRSEIHLRLGSVEGALEDLEKGKRAAPYGWDGKEKFLKQKNYILSAGPAGGK